MFKYDFLFCWIIFEFPKKTEWKYVLYQCLFLSFLRLSESLLEDFLSLRLSFRSSSSSRRLSFFFLSFLCFFRSTSLDGDRSLLFSFLFLFSRSSSLDEDVFLDLFLSLFFFLSFFLCSSAFCNFFSKAFFSSFDNPAIHLAGSWSLDE